jgi:NSS family neurotransmitter:Na+ symporter
MSGVAIGLGNIWRFPYMMGQYGGSAFLIMYLLIAAAFGVPALMAEWVLGRHTRRGPWGAYQAAGMPAGKLWSAVILVTVITAASYYAVIIGWVLQEAVAFARAAISGRPVEGFASLTMGPGRQLVYVAVTVVLGCSIIGFGVRGGIERASRIVMPLFFVLFIVLAVRVLMLDGAGAGLQKFLRPEWQSFTGRTALAALGQAVFSLGLGGMFMVRYGSYMADGEDIPRQAFATTAADVSAALLAGLIIVPAVIVFGLDLQSGPTLMFEAMPAVFGVMPAGAIFGAVFFFSVFIVAVLSLIAAYEVIGTALEETLGWTRARSLVVVAVGEIALALPCYLVAGYIGKSDLIWGSTMQPFGAAIAVVALAWCVGRSRALDELRRNTGLPIPGWLFYWIKFALPMAILTILVFGWVDWFASS